MTEPLIVTVADSEVWERGWRALARGGPPTKYWTEQQVEDRIEAHVAAEEYA